MTMRLLVFGSSARRGATGWTNTVALRDLFTRCTPDLVIHGASPAGGADKLADDVARTLGIARLPCPVETDKDGPWPWAGMKRNERMFVETEPTIAAGFITGPVGSAMSSGSRYMAEICARGWGGCAAVPLVIHRDNGVEPIRGILSRRSAVETAIDQMRLLYLVAGRDPALVPPGQAVRAVVDGHAQIETDRETIQTAFDCAAEQAPRWSPWLASIETTLLTTAGDAPLFDHRRPDRS
jgi:hypothetical protein